MDHERNWPQDILVGAVSAVGVFLVLTGGFFMIVSLGGSGQVAKSRVPKASQGASVAAAPAPAANSGRPSPRPGALQPGNAGAPAESRLPDTSSRGPRRGPGPSAGPPSDEPVSGGHQTPLDRMAAMQVPEFDTRYLQTTEEDLHARMWSGSSADEDTPSGRPRFPRQRDPRKAPSPSSGALMSAAKQVNDTFNLSKPRTDGEELALSRELFGLSDQPPPGSAERFVLMRVAAEMASQGGDAALMCETIDKISDQFDVSPLVLKANMLQSFADRADEPAKIGSLVVAVRRYVDQALSIGQPDFATSAVSRLYQVCQRPQGKAFLAEVSALRDKIQAINEARQRQQSLLGAREDVEEHPDDPAANFRLGMMLCFGREEWREGLKHLAKGTDPSLAKLAEQDLRSPDEPAEQVKLADAWWVAAEGFKRDEFRNAMKRHASSWYRKAQPNLTGLEKAKVSKRLEEVDKISGPSANKGG